MAGTPMGRNHRVRGGAKGNKASVVFDCPHCGNQLRADLSDAGTPDTCPHCAGGFVVPGVDELKEQQAQREREVREQQQRRQEEKQRERERAARARAVQERKAREKAAREQGADELEADQPDRAEGGREISGMRITGGVLCVTGAPIAAIAGADGAIAGTAIGCTVFLAGVVLIGLGTVNESVRALYRELSMAVSSTPPDRHAIAEGNAQTLSLLGLLVPPLAIAGIVWGLALHHATKGRCGLGAVGLGFLAVILWLMVLAGRALPL